MIITRSPFRISLGGGGTDLPSYYSKFGAYVLSAAINKYLFISLQKTFHPALIFKYSEVERVNHIDEIKHPIIKQAVKSMNYNFTHLEIASLADIPAGTGLGSSASFTVALLKALYTFQQRFIAPHDLAELACDIEINQLGLPVGKQDQYIATFGGLTQLEIDTAGNVVLSQLKLDELTLHTLQENLLLFFTGFSRNSSQLLQQQALSCHNNDALMFENLHTIKQLGLQTKTALLSGDLRLFADLMNQHWFLKRQRSKNMSNDSMDDVYQAAIKNGALGGKLVGAGGGGFFLFYAEDKMKLRHKMQALGVQEVHFNFDYTGTTVMANL